MVRSCDRNILTQSARRPSRAVRRRASRSSSAPRRRSEPLSTPGSPPRRATRARRAWATRRSASRRRRTTRRSLPRAFTVAAGPAQPLRFRVLGEDGKALRAGFEVEAERRLHLIVVRRDLTGYQHLHPAMAADGTWSVPLKVAQPGAYRVFADFQRSCEKHVLAADLLAAGRFPAGRTARSGADRERRTATTSGSSGPRCTRAAKRRSASPSAAADGPSARSSRISERAAISSRCARATSRTCTPTPRSTRTPPARFRSRPTSSRRAPTGCSCSSGSAGSSTPPASRSRSHRERARRRPAARSAHRGHDVRLVRQPHRAQAQHGSKASRRRSTTRPSARASASTRERVTPGELVAAVEAAGYAARLPSAEAAPRTVADPTRALRFRLIVRGRPLAARAGAGDDPGAAVRLLAVALAPARHAGRAVGGLAVPQGRLAEPPPRRRDHGHAHLASARSPPGAGRWSRSSSSTRACRRCACRSSWSRRARRRATRSISRSPPSSRR